MRDGRGDAIVSPRARSTRRAACASFHPTHVARPQRFWADSYVDNHSNHRSEERRLGRAQRTLQESGTVVGGDTPGSKCAFGATRTLPGRGRATRRSCLWRHGGHDRVA